MNVINAHRIILFCCLLFTACNPRPSTASLDPFTGDSGYITLEQLFPYVLQNKIIDTTASEGRWRDIPARDTFGKYYRYKDGYIACVVNVNPPFESLVLFQTNANGQVENIQPYYHGNYCNCWNGSFGFGKIKDYFFVRICGTGTAFTSSTLHIFRELGKQSEGQGIYEYLWRGSMTEADDYRRIELSSLQLDNNKIHASYVKLEGNKKDQVPGYFEINYTLTNGAWIPDNNISLYSN
ncbi:hypothetical protein [Chitinophaga sp.]|uniref:hypothetical protein n=1 Tax=Chitinophaga sp. TaxID=1869181 RepID=UPI0031E07E1D